MKKQYDAVIVGAGFAGSVCARVLAEGGRTVLLLDRRDHIGGNAYDELDESGVLIHKYGPHIFHTNDREVYEFLSRFTEWNGYQHRVLGRVGDLSMPIPFNLDSLSVAYGKEEAASLEALLIEKYAGAFPLWLAPEQIRVLPIGDEHVEYAAKVRDRLSAAGLRVELDDSSNTIGYKIRATQMQKVPYMLIIGAKEVEEGTVSVRNRAGETVTKNAEQFLADALLEVAEKRR